MLIRGRSVWKCIGLVCLQLACAGTALAQSWGLDLDCTESDTSYKGTARGTLTTTTRNSNGEFVLRGGLDISIREWSGAASSEHVEVEGTIWKDGGMGHLLVRSASSLSATEVWIQPTEDWGSDVRIAFPSAPGGYRDYSMDCSASQLRLPQIRNLVLRRDRSYAIVLPAGSTTSVNSYLYVTNDGNQPVTPGPIRVRVAGRVISAQLRPSSTGDTSIPPDFSGIIQLNFAPNTILRRCQSYAVELDLDRARQSGPGAASDPTGAFNPFNDDKAMAASPCLTWTTPIDSQTLGSAPPQSSILEYKSLQEIVSGEVTGRVDGKFCLECHVSSANKPYKAPAGLILSTDEITGWSWAQPGGWAQQFIAQDGRPGSKLTKPGYLIAAFQRWLNDGMR